METQNEVNWIGENSRFQGKLELSGFTRFEGYLMGNLEGLPESEVVIGINGFVEGEVRGNIIYIDGFVRGKIVAGKKVLISSTGRVIGEIEAPQFSIQFGGFFEGYCSTNDLP